MDKDYHPLLTVNNLTVYHSSSDKVSPLVENLTFSIQKKERLSIIGNSGSGKSLTLKAILGILPENLSLSENTCIQFNTDDTFKKRFPSFLKTLN